MAEMLAQGEGAQFLPLPLGKGINRNKNRNYELGRPYGASMISGPPVPYWLAAYADKSR